MTWIWYFLGIWFDTGVVAMYVWYGTGTRVKMYAWCHGIFQVLYNLSVYVWIRCRCDGLVVWWLSCMHGMVRVERSSIFMCSMVWYG